MSHLLNYQPFQTPQRSHPQINHHSFLNSISLQYQLLNPLNTNPNPITHQTRS